LACCAIWQSKHWQIYLGFDELFKAHTPYQLLIWLLPCMTEMVLAKHILFAPTQPEGPAKNMAEVD
jgi:hypothetical protein